MLSIFKIPSADMFVKRIQKHLDRDPVQQLLNVEIWWRQIYCTRNADGIPEARPRGDVNYGASSGNSTKVSDVESPSWKVEGALVPDFATTRNHNHTPERAAALSITILVAMVRFAQWLS